MLFFQAVIIFNDRGTGPVNRSKGRAQIVGDGPQQGGPHFFGLALHPQLFLLFDAGGQGAGHNGHHQHRHAREQVFRQGEVEGKVRGAERKIHGQHADQGSHHAQHITIRIDRDQKNCQNKHHRCNAIDPAGDLLCAGHNEKGGAQHSGNNEPARIVIGKDTRRSSYMFEYSLVAGLTASGADAYLLHVTTTPSVAYIARVDDFDCGIMISASHNPFYDNGIKLIDCYGEKMPEETLLLVEDYIDGKLHVFDQDWPELPFAHREHIGCTVDYVAGRNRYMGYLISLGIYSFKGIKVGLDCANGASWNIAKSVFDALGADTYVINNQPNGLNINLNAGSTHIEGLQKFVVEKGLDVGFAYDGDADRCLCVDEKGNVITGDHILYIYGCYMKERGKLLTNTVVTTVMSNFGLYKAFDEQGIGYAKTAVGDKYVYEYMAKNGCRIGGEQSGHIIFSKYASTGDGILTSLKMMEVMLAKKKPLSALAAPLKIYPQVLENVRVTDKKAAQDDAAVQAAVKAVAEALGDTGRILVRESGTEPVVRVMVEAPDHDTCQKYVSQVVDVIKAQGYSV